MHRLQVPIARSLVLMAAASMLLIACPPAPENTSKTPDRERITQAKLDAGAYELMELIEFGRSLNIRNFGVEDGYGNGRNGAVPPNFSRLDGPDSTSCNSCHGLGNVVMGWGSNEGNVLVSLDSPVSPTVTGSNERNTTMVHGAAWIELLAKEITDTLQEIRSAALAQAAAANEPVTVGMTAKGIDYGQIIASPGGTVDYSNLDGIDADLRVRPFHAKGHEASIRIFTRGALNRHHGIQSHDLLLFMDPTKDSNTWDEDRDGMVDELNEAELTAMTLHQVCLPAPVETRTGEVSNEAGRQLMAAFDCNACHIPYLPVENHIWRDTSSTGTVIEVDLTDPVLGLPRVEAEENGPVNLALWGDLKRHDLGAEALEPLDQPIDKSLPWWDGGARGEHIIENLPPIPKELMLTTELWGVGDTGPWWHDGSSPTIEDAILRHGGEAQASRDAYAAASAQEQGQLLAFLNQLRIGVVAEPFVRGKVDATRQR